MISMVRCTSLHQYPSELRSDQVLDLMLFRSTRSELACAQSCLLPLLPGQPGRNPEQTMLAPLGFMRDVKRER